ncbi:MAG: hypothetical protein L6408_03750 [Nanoarchaeota archaeon]|nr:hypothetical protein [Nanoarchaeota archaeon]
MKIEKLVKKILKNTDIKKGYIQKLYENYKFYNLAVESACYDCDPEFAITIADHRNKLRHKIIKYAEENL